ncbi:MAG: substrate-binding domain-containing protein, partial [Planctomycetes bacterium]|nr:substrate-binding domain-containing protein [Planctomycetota bacterium]
MFDCSAHVRFRFLIVALAATAIGATSVSAQEVLQVYGSEGPYPAMREAATVFAERNTVDLQIVADSVEKWLSQAKAEADLVYSSAEFMMVDIIQGMGGEIDENSATPLYWRPAAILVRPGNPKHIYDFPDLLRPGVKVMVVNGSGQTGLWEDMAGRRGNFRTVHALRNNIVLFATDSTEARRMWLAEDDIDAWLTWNIWYQADPRHSTLVPVSEDYVIYRQCSIALTKRGRQKPLASQFVGFLKSPEAAEIFAKWGWITTSTEASPGPPRSIIRLVCDIQDDDSMSDTAGGLRRLEQIIRDYESMGIPRGELNISAVFHGDAAYLTLQDESYNALMKRVDGNPSKSVILDLIKRGVSIELCARTMKQNGWKCADILPEVK